MRSDNNATQIQCSQPRLDDVSGASPMSSSGEISGGRDSSLLKKPKSENKAPVNADSVQSSGATEFPVDKFSMNFEGLRHMHSVPYSPPLLYHADAAMYHLDNPLTSATPDSSPLVNDRSRFDSMENSLAKVVNSGMLVQSCCIVLLQTANTN